MYTIDMLAIDEGRTIESAQATAEKLYQFALDHGLSVSSVDVRRVREKEPIESVSIGSSGIFRNERATEVTTSRTDERTGQRVPS